MKKKSLSVLKAKTNLNCYQTLKEFLLLKNPQTPSSCRCPNPFISPTNPLVKYRTTQQTNLIFFLNTEKYKRLERCVVYHCTSLFEKSVIKSNVNNMLKETNLV